MHTISGFSLLANPEPPGLLGSKRPYPFKQEAEQNLEWYHQEGTQSVQSLG